MSEKVEEVSKVDRTKYKKIKNTAREKAKTLIKPKSKEENDIPTSLHNNSDNNNILEIGKPTKVIKAVIFILHTKGSAL